LSQSFTVQTTTIVNYTPQPTTAAQAIKYEISSIKIVATKLMDESGLQESNPRPKIDLPHVTQEHD
jgi:hypothetical protein